MAMVPDTTPSNSLSFLSFPLCTWIRSHVYTLATIALLAAMAGPFLVKRDSEWNDVYLRAAAHMRTGQDMYLFQEGYLYPPFMAFLAIPFTFLTPLAARAAWFPHQWCLSGLAFVRCLAIVWWTVQAGYDYQQQGGAPHLLAGAGLWLPLCLERLRSSTDRSRHCRHAVGWLRVVAPVSFAYRRNLVWSRRRHEMHTAPLGFIPGLARPLAGSPLVGMCRHRRQPVAQSGQHSFQRRSVGRGMVSVLHPAHEYFKPLPRHLGKPSRLESICCRHL